MSRVIAWLLAAACFVSILTGRGQDEAPAPRSDVDWTARYVDAWHRECAEHDLDAALDGYREVLAAEGATPPLRALAGLSLAYAHERLDEPRQAAAYLLRVAREFEAERDIATLARERLAWLQAREERPVGTAHVVDARLEYLHPEGGAGLQLGDATRIEVPPGGRYSLAVTLQGETAAFLHLLRQDLGEPALAVRLLPDQFDRFARPVELAPGRTYALPRDLGWGVDAWPEPARGRHVVFHLIVAPRALPEDLLAQVAAAFLEPLPPARADLGRRHFRPAARAAQERLRGLDPAAQLYSGWVWVRP